MSMTYLQSHIVDATRKAFNLSKPQAEMVLIAYDLGTVTTATATLLTNVSDPRMISAHGYLRVPKALGLLRMIGRYRETRQSPFVGVYALVDRAQLTEVVKEAERQAEALRGKIEAIEIAARRSLPDESQ